MKGVRVAVAGAGIQMRRHLVPALTQLGCTIVAVIDPDLSRAHELGATLSAPAAEALDAVADICRIDAIVAACPPFSHEHVIHDAITAGVPILVEKPPASRGEAVRELAQLAKAARVPVCVGMNYRHAPGFRALRARLLGEDRRIEYAHVMHLGLLTKVGCLTCGE